MGDELLVCSGLGRRFGDLEAVRDLTFSVRSGEIVGLLGPNGAGKTTTLRMLVGLLHPTSGSATIAGHDVVKEDLAVRRAVGYMPETPALLDAMELETFFLFMGDVHGLSRRESRRRSAELAERLSLAGMGRAALGSLSFGTRKKVLLVGLLLSDPRVLLLDEPTAGLDPASAASVHEILTDRVSAGSAVLISTHLLDAAERLCHRVAVVNHGKLVALGAPAEIRSGRGGKDLTAVFLELTRSDER